MSSKIRRKDKYNAYYTPKELAELMVSKTTASAWKTETHVVEPGFGGGVFLEPLAQKFTHVHGYEIDPDAEGWARDFTAPEGHHIHLRRESYLDAEKPAPEVDLVIGNPDFSIARESVEKGLEWSKHVVFLLRLGFVEGANRLHWWEKEAPLRSVSILVPRIPFRRRVFDENDEWDGSWTEKGSDSATYAIFYFERGCKPGGANMQWLQWREPRRSQC